jgi:colanic acid/amylovoran biosynthesis glycosyltransferase
MKTIAHAWLTYMAGQDADLHRELQRRGLFRSLLLADRIVANGAVPDPPSYWRGKTATAPAVARLEAAAGRLLPGVFRRRRETFYERHIREHGAELIHAHFGTCAAELIDLQQRLGLPMIATFYGVDVSAVIQIPAWVERYRRLFKAADRLLVLDDEVKARLVRIGCPPEKLVVWNMPLDFGRYVYRERHPDGPIKLVTAARFVEKKGYPVMLRALARLKAEGRAVRLTALGYGPLKRQILADAAQLGLTDEVELIDTAPRPDFPQLYADVLASHDIFIIASTQARNADDEGGPALTLVMAQAAGLPVVCTPFVGSQRSVHDGETGLFSAPNSAESLAERVGYLIDHPELWNLLGATASAYVRENFDKDRQVDQVAAIYQELLDDGET